MTDPEDPTRRWDRVPELGGPPVRRRPPVPGTVPPAEPDAQPWLDWDGDPEPVDEPEPAPRAERARPRDPVWRVVTRGLGELLVTAGIVLLLFAVYEVYVTDLLNDRTQGQLSDQLHQQWDAGPPLKPGTPIAPQVEPPVGEPLAVLHVPRLGKDYQRVVLEGTAEDELAKGPGHYAGTALPGQPGNLAIAGHRVGKGSPFLDADQLRPGDPIVVETADAWYVYRVLGNPGTGDYGTDASGIPGQQIVPPSDVSVIAPVPGDPAGVQATQAYLTLTTCHPKYSARQRLIVHAVLDGKPIAKADDPDGPSALKEG